MRLFLVAMAAVGLFSSAAFARLMVSIRDTLNIIERLLLAPTRKRLFRQSRWTRTMAVAITCTGRLGTEFKISPRATGFSAGLQLPFSIILALRSRVESRTIRARRNKSGGLFVCFVRALVRDCGGDRAWSTFRAASPQAPSLLVPPEVGAFSHPVKTRPRRSSSRT